MPHTLEAFKLVEVADMRARRMVVALMCGVFFGILASFWAYLVVSYDIGANPWVGQWRLSQAPIVALLSDRNKHPCGNIYGG